MCVRVCSPGLDEGLVRIAMGSGGNDTVYVCWLPTICTMAHLSTWIAYMDPLHQVCKESGCETAAGSAQEQRIMTTHERPKDPKFCLKLIPAAPNSPKVGGICLYTLGPNVGVIYVLETVPRASKKELN